MHNANRKKKTKISSWSHILPTTTYLQSITAATDFSLGKDTFIVRGSGSSFNDASYITDGKTLTTENLKRISDFNPEARTVTCEAGVEIGQLHEFLEKTDLAFPIYGGSQWVTVGGAIAADIHGKNSHTQGSFGNHVEKISLTLADGREIECSRDVNADLFVATIGGMGLTGFIRAATLRLLKRISSSLYFHSNIINAIEEAVANFGDNESEFSFYTHGNISGKTLGTLYSANYSDESSSPPRTALNFPVPLLKPAQNRLLLNAADRILMLLYKNTLNKQGSVHIRYFNFMGIHQFIRPVNKFLGPVIEYQFVVSDENSLLQIYRDFSSRKWDFNLFSYVLKKFGPVQSPGLLSFVQPGYTLGIWVPEGTQTRQQFTAFTERLLQLGGRVYLAKDSCATAKQFEKMYPQLDEWRRIVKQYDPHNRIQSDLSKRLDLKPW